MANLGAAAAAPSLLLLAPTKPMDLNAIRQAWLDHLQQHRAIAVIRGTTPAAARKMASAAAAGGIRLLEITWTTPQAAQVILRLRHDLPHCQIGAGSILSEAALRAAAGVGAQFIFSPHTDAALVQAACQHQIPITPGALSPTEIITAWNAGAASVKVFPITAIGGAAYIRALQGPLGHIPLVPTGGVTLNSATPLLEAGATAFGISTALFPKPILLAEAWDELAQRAAEVSKLVVTWNASVSSSRGNTVIGEKTNGINPWLA